MYTWYTKFVKVTCTFQIRSYKIEAENQILLKLLSYIIDTDLQAIDMSVCMLCIHSKHVYLNICLISTNIVRSRSHDDNGNIGVVTSISWASEDVTGRLCQGLWQVTKLVHVRNIVYLQK